MQRKCHAFSHTFQPSFRLTANIDHYESRMIMENKQKLCKHCKSAPVFGRYSYCEACRAEGFGKKRKRPRTLERCARCGELFQKKQWNQKYCLACRYEAVPKNKPKVSRQKTPWRKFPKPPMQKSVPSIKQVDEKAAELGISYGKCSLLIAQGKISL